MNRLMAGIIASAIGGVLAFIIVEEIKKGQQQTIQILQGGDA